MNFKNKTRYTTSVLISDIQNRFSAHHYLLSRRNA